MATYNPYLENLSLEEIEAISTRYLMGWQDLMADGCKFRVKGLNRRRAEYGLEPLTREMSNQYRLDYVRANFTSDEIAAAISDYLASGRVAEARWTGIFLFDCRFGREYVTLFRELMGSSAYRKASEAARVKKLVETHEIRYGGVGLAGEATKEKACVTVMARYGVKNVMQVDCVRAAHAASVTSVYGAPSPFSSQEVRDKAVFSKWKHIQDKLKQVCDDRMAERLLKSKGEALAYLLLVDRFGRDAVFYEYGIHPSDKRYPHNCDFYIKPLDLFIEMHCHYSHGDHWFNPGNPDDVLRLSNLAMSVSKKSREAARVWTDVDIKKRSDAEASGIQYLVFWDGTVMPAAQGGLPNLKDFYEWFYDYDCDYAAFVKDHPENTY